MIVLILILATVCLAVATNWQRAYRQIDFKLMPNCLMTQAPLVFVTGWRSPFYFLKYWNNIPHYLREHGYEVIELELPWRNSLLRAKELSTFLEASQRAELKFHFVFDAAGKDEAQKLKEWGHPAVQSITVATPEFFGWSEPVEGLSYAQKYSAGALFFRFALLCHRFYLPKHLDFSPTIAGEPYSAPFLGPEKEFLRLAISLAEKEIKVSHNVTHDVHQ